MQKAKKWQNKNYVFRMVYARDNDVGAITFVRKKIQILPEEFFLLSWSNFPNGLKQKKIIEKASFK